MDRLRAILAGPIEALVAVFLFGVVGYRLIEGWSTLDAVWMVAITLSTIGYGEIHPLSPVGRVFTLVLIGVTLLWAGRFVTQLAQLIAEGGLIQEWKKARLRRELDAMNGHYIVIGRGRLGREILAELVHHGVPVVVIDPKPFEGEPCANVIHIAGDATHDDVLREAHIERARGVAIATPSDAINIYLALSVRQLNPAAFVTVRVEEDTAADKARRAGANRVLLPYHLSGSRMAQAMLRPGASAFVERTEQRHDEDLQLEDIVVPEGSPAAGRLASLDVRQRFDLIVVAVARNGDAPSLPDDRTVIGPGDTLIVVGRKHNIAAFAAWAARA